MELTELKELLAQTGLPNQAIEKRLHMGNGIIGKVLKGTYKAFPVHKEKGLRKLAREGEVKQQMDKMVKNIVEPEEMPVWGMGYNPASTDIPLYYPPIITEKIETETFNTIQEAMDSEEPPTLSESSTITQEELNEVMEQLGVVKPYPQVEEEKEIKRPDSSLFDLLP